MPRDLNNGTSSVLFHRLRCAIIVRRFQRYPMRRCSAISVSVLLPAAAVQPRSDHALNGLLFEIVADRGVQPGDRRIGMTDLSLHERRVVAGLDQVRDVGMSQAVQSELFRQAGTLAGGGEGITQATHSYPLGALARP